MTTKWYTILVLAVLSISMIEMSIGKEDDTAPGVYAAAGSPTCNPACGTGYMCVKGTCVQNCAKNTDCTDPAICDIRKGYCVSNPKACDDGNVCTSYDTTIKNKCQGTPVADDTACAGGAGRCVSGACSCSCDDGDACTTDIYDSPTDMCYNIPKNCGDGDCCNGVCTYLSMDDSNCGACGNKCSGTMPRCCGGVCVDGSSDMNNCGYCGNACLENEACNDGQCSCPDPDGYSANAGRCNMGTYPNTNWVCCAPGTNCAYDPVGQINVCCPTDRVATLGPGNYNCCPEETTPCGSSCCGADQTCDTFSSTCSCGVEETMCGYSCCTNGQRCAFIDGSYQCLNNPPG